VAAQRFVGINDISGLRVIHLDRDGYSFPPRDGEKKVRPKLVSEDSHRAQVPIQSRTKPLNTPL
jgi:hypothetical protein